MHIHALHVACVWRSLAFRTRRGGLGRAHLAGPVGTQAGHRAHLVHLARQLEVVELGQVGRFHSLAIAEISGSVARHIRGRSPQLGRANGGHGDE